MTVDPGEPDSFRGRFAEPIGAEAPEADAAEQLTDVQQEEDDPLTGADRDDAPEADAAEQARVVPLDEEDYR
ncbi:hypothetical protein BX286_4811 [Streptomyces sp. 3211.6]|uniref:hypothetical protein n=1 Tax=Streptomyces TaxID=1883 RepID=UPI0009A4D948|nr:MULTISPECIES: hypothetical protein [Streptomyces]RKT06766.1 hypothetical protein BX286_4811 [Streptomyces sp. 3211.6]RPF45624.1 hypothetical protein EDD96_2186 [Streptomyces sp. Ag109_G2-6]